MVPAGCVETIVMDPGEENLPVMVNCVLEAGFGKQTLYLQYVKGKSRSEYIPIENATVRMEASEGLIRQIEFKYLILLHKSSEQCVSESPYIYFRKDQ